jgi:hypothetical protein
MAEWLKRCGIRTVAMQSTGVYWVAVQEIQEREGFEVYLVNARGAKNLPGRKSDVQEGQWLRKLHTYGRLVKFLPSTGADPCRADHLAAAGPAGEGRNRAGDPSGDSSGRARSAAVG